MRELLTLCACLAIAPGCGSDNNGGDGDGDGDGDAGPDANLPDCPTTALVAPTDFNVLSHVKASEDFALDADGFLVGVEVGSGALSRTGYTPGSGEVIAPDVSSFGRGTRILPGGDIVVANPDTGMIERFAANGSSTPLVSLNDPNGIAVGLDGMVYVTTGGGRVVRIDPDTRDLVELHSSPGRTFDGIGFSPDFRYLYFDQESGEISRIEITAAGAAGPPEPFATITPEFLLDGMTTDVCGNLYVIEMAGVVWRVTPAGQADMWLDLKSADPFICAVNFGSGRGGWGETSIYVMNLNDDVFEAEVGVAGRVDPHLR